MKLDNSDLNKPAVRKRDAEIVALIKKGELSMRAIGKMFDISYQRVGQIWLKANPRGKKNIVNWSLSDSKKDAIRVKP